MPTPCPMEMVFTTWAGVSCPGDRRGYGREKVPGTNLGESELALPERQEKTQQSPVLEGKEVFPGGRAGCVQCCWEGE